MNEICDPGTKSVLAILNSVTEKALAHRDLLLFYSDIYAWPYINAVYETTCLRRIQLS